jgi:hypothetical protein
MGFSPMAFRIVSLRFGQRFLKTMGGGRDPKRSRGRHNRRSSPLIEPRALSNPCAIVMKNLKKVCVL